MENITFEIKGYIVTFKPFLTFGQKRELEKLMAGSMSVDAKTNKPNTNIAGSIVYEAQDLTLKMMIVELKNPSGQVFQGTDAFEAIQNLTDEEVGKAIYKKLDEITSSKTLTPDSKKK